MYYSKKYKDGNVQPSHSNAFVNEHASYQIGENSNEIAGTDLKSKYESSKIQIRQLLKTQLELLDNSNLDLVNNSVEGE